nr:glyoxalase superfamily protein [Saccharibacillus alkalitolerans]
MEITGLIPVLRIFDERQAKDFYVEYLGFEVDWEHRFEEGLPLYLQVSRHSVGRAGRQETRGGRPTDAAWLRNLPERNGGA